MAAASSPAPAPELIEDAKTATLILILSDINMPGMSGLDLLPRADAARPDVPVIMITAYGDAETRDRVLSSGAEALHDKQIDFTHLRREIDTRVEKAARPGIQFIFNLRCRECPLLAHSGLSCAPTTESALEV